LKIVAKCCFEEYVGCIEKDLGPDTVDAAKRTATFNPDNTWIALQ